MTGTTVSAADNAIFSIDAQGLRIAGNTVRSAGNAASWSGARRPATTARWWSITASRTSPTNPAAPGSTATPSMCFALITSWCAATAFKTRRSQRCAAMLRPTCKSSVTPATRSARSRSMPNSASKARDRQQHRGRRRGRRFGDQFQRRRPARRGAGQPDPQSRTHRPAGTDPNDGAGIGIGVEADTAVSGNSSRMRRTSASPPAGANICATSQLTPM